MCYLASSYSLILTIALTAYFWCPQASYSYVRTHLTIKMPSSSPPLLLLSQVLTDVVKTTIKQATEGQTLFALIATI